MKRKKGRLLALLLAVVMVVAGLQFIPTSSVSAATKPKITIKMSQSVIKPGDKVTAELWLEPGCDIGTLTAGLVYDSDVFQIVRKSIATYGPQLDSVGTKVTSWDDDGMFPTIIADFSDGVIYANEDDEEGTNAVEYIKQHGVHLLSVNLKVKDTATKAGFVGIDQFNCILADGKDTSLVGNDKAEVVVSDNAGTVISEGKVPLDVALESVVLNPKDNFTMTVGSESTLTLTGTPDGALDGKTVEWKSSNEAAVKVAGNGATATLTAAAAGESTITATVDGKSASVTVKVEVKQVPLESIALNKTKETVNMGDTLELAVTYTPNNTTDSKTVAWTSSDEKVAKVDAAGKVTPVAPGKATITATVNGKKATCEVEVKAPLKSIAIYPSSVSVIKGGVTAVGVSFNPENTTDDTFVTWESDNVNVATVKSLNENGSSAQITGVSEGTATITAKLKNGKTATCTVSVGEKHIESVTVSPATLTLEAGETKALVATTSPADTTDAKTIEWSSDNTSVATVDADGVVTAVAGGTAKITAKTVNGKTAVCTVKVPVRMTGIELSKDKVEVLKGKTSEAIGVTYLPAGHEDTEGVTWASADTSIATVDANGCVTGVKAGTTTVTATSKTGGFKAECEVTVKEVAVESVTFDKVDILKGGNSTLAPTVSPVDTTDVITYEYTVEDETVAVVENGVVKALKSGSTKVSVKVLVNGVARDDLAKTFDVVVEEVHLESVAIDDKTAEAFKNPVEVGTKITLGYALNPANATDELVVAWTSSDEAVAKVEGGVLTALKAGKATITVDVNGKTASFEVTVVEKKAPTTPDDTKKPSTDSPKTGDMTSVPFVAWLMVISAVAIAVVAFVKRRRFFR